MESLLCGGDDDDDGAPPPLPEVVSTVVLDRSKLLRSASKRPTVLLLFLPIPTTTT
jgi:hypothetical protein